MFEQSVGQIWTSPSMKILNCINFLIYCLHQHFAHTYTSSSFVSFNAPSPPPNPHPHPLLCNNNTLQSPSSSFLHDPKYDFYKMV
ncbi:hypothetical protein RJT34_30161 [Clitoria ternatea]|uniref:Uncharacterized protein n=1 Tax=Clitoria ternatea TaxID=43366 RepID=A0AAN9ES88_CLITE